MELAVEDAQPPLPGTGPGFGNVALTLYRQPWGSMPAQATIAATNLSAANIDSLTVRWRAYPG